MATCMKIRLVSNAIPYRLIQCHLKGHSQLLFLSFLLCYHPSSFPLTAYTLEMRSLQWCTNNYYCILGFVLIWGTYQVDMGNKIKWSMRFRLLRTDKLGDMLLALLNSWHKIQLYRTSRHATIKQGSLKLNKYAFAELKHEYWNKHQVSKTFCKEKTKRSTKLHKSKISGTSSESHLCGTEGKNCNG